MALCTVPYRLRSGFLWLLCALASTAVSAEGITVGAATRGPSTSAEDSIESVAVRDEVVDLNPQALPVLTTRGYESTTRVLVDGVSGLVKGSSAINVPSTIVGGISPSSYAGGLFTVAAPFVGPGTGPVTVVVELQFDGAFTATTGDPFLNLIGTVSAGASSLYSSTLGFWQGYQASGVQIETIAEDENGQPYAGATPLVISAAPDSLAGIARVTFEAHPGELVAFAAGLTGISSAAYGGASDWLPSAGTVDFLHTGTLKITVPQGYGFDSDAPLLQNVVQVVPEPNTMMLFAIGMVAVAAYRSRRRTGQVA